jgi:hypothetical protein
MVVHVVALSAWWVGWDRRSSSEGGGPQGRNVRRDRGQEDGGMGREETVGG